MIKKICIVVFAFVMVAAPAMLFASGQRDSGQKEIWLIPKLTGNAFFEAANDGAQAHAKANGYTVRYVGHPEASVAEQVRIIRQAIAQGVDGISVSSLDATALDGAMQDAMRAGLAVTTWDADVSGNARSVMVSQGTPDILGRMLVDMGVDALRNRGLDPNTAIRYVWHYSQATVADQNSWNAAGEAYIRQNFPRWINVRPENYYSNQNPEQALSVGQAILQAHGNIDLIICNDSTALPGQLQAAQNLGRNASNVTITGFAPPNSIKPFARAGIVERWGLWDAGQQGALGAYLAFHLASGKQIRIGDKINVPGIGTVEVLPNTVLDPGAFTSPTSGVVLLPERVVFTAANMDNYNF
ncbi:MAG: substrate-binding domain-containing protein [Treponema sp.]|nr:substrate-binding domain-containing protein [Treponema sp.]